MFGKKCVIFICFALLSLLVFGDVSAQNLQNAKPGIVSGKIINGLTNAPINDVKIFVSDFGLIAQSYNEGDFTFPLPAGEYQVKFEKSDYTSKTATKVVVQSGDKTRLSIQMFPKVVKNKDVPKGAGVVTGTVTNKDNHPLSGVSIAVEGLKQKVVSDDEGNFMFILSPGEYKLRFDKRNYYKTESNITINSEEKSEVSIQMEPEVFCQIKGQITGEDGGPLYGANVTVLDTHKGAMADVDGRYTIDIEEGVYDVKASFIGYSPVTQQGVQVKTDSITTVDFQLEEGGMDLGITIDVSAKPAMIEKDRTSTGFVRSGEDIDKQAAADFTEVLDKDPVVKKGTVAELEPEIMDSDFSFDAPPPPPPPASEVSAIVIPREPKPKPKPKRLAPKTPVISGLKAGYADDNKQFNYFLGFLEEYHRAAYTHLPMKISERIILNVKDSNGKSIPNGAVEIYVGKDLVSKGKTYADGTYLFFPEDGDKFTAKVISDQNEKEVEFSRDGKRTLDVIFDSPREEMQSIPLDILFVLDTTGSMSEEINQLKSTIEIIHLNLSSLATNIKVRFGMVLYRDKTDEYITKIIPLTEDLEYFQSQLDEVYADGGGDTPEDLQSALDDAVNKIEWTPDGLRLGFIITDAPPHTDYKEQKYTYVNAAKDAKKMGIKFFSVGTGGLPITGEYILRQIAQYTYGKYIFLTYGEKGESHGGKVGSVSHHTGENFVTDKLEAIIIRFAKEELSHVTDQTFDIAQEYFEAHRISDETPEETLEQLFDQSLSQLIDYSTFHFGSETPAAVIPFGVAEESQAKSADYFCRQLEVSVSKNGIFNMVERRDLEKIMSELAIQMTGIVDDKSVVEAGKGIGAELLITGNLYPKTDQYELFLKLLRVETDEVLSVTKLKIDKQLGL